jgi:Uma2 family endonuclease
MTSVIQVQEVHYPETDGKPMGETDEHRDEMVRHIELLRYYFRNQQVYVSGNLLVYFEQGNPKKFVVPDVMVVKDVDPRKRRIFKTWIEGKGPDAVIETTSRKTRRKDVEGKPLLYARMGVKEYFLFDPDQEYLDPPLQGHRLDGGKYVAILVDETGALVSGELGLRLRVESGMLQFFDLATGERLLTAAERNAAAEAAIARLRAEWARRKEDQ